MITHNSLGIQGRFGNQMFQLALLLSISNKKKYDFFLPKSNLDNGTITLNECFDLNIEWYKSAYISNTYREVHFSYDENVFNIPDNTSLFGYFQSDKYFNDCEDIILNTFKIKEELLEKSFDSLKNVPQKKVSIHVRRGDYTYSSNVHPPISVDYIKKAISTFSDEYAFVFFSDDIEWCKTNFKSENFFYYDADDPFLNFSAMSLCEHNIISNSSYSWWASYLNKNKNKVVVAPSLWFGPDGPQDWQDIYRKDMIVI